MRVDTNKSLVKISAPSHVDTPTVVAFLHRNKPWLERQVEKRPSTQFVREGSVVPFKGRDYEIFVDQSVAKITVDDEAGLLRLPARGEPILRLQRFLVEEAGKDFQARAERLAERLGKPFRTLRVRDTKTRWGSCSSKGGLNFCWRLIFAEDWVREYVVAHEVAHLKHMDHSPAFWAQCEALFGTTAQVEAAKSVLVAEGNRWHALIFDGSAGR